MQKVLKNTAYVYSLTFVSVNRITNFRIMSTSHNMLLYEIKLNECQYILEREEIVNL